MTPLFLSIREVAELTRESTWTVKNLLRQESTGRGKVAAGNRQQLLACTMRAAFACGATASHGDSQRQRDRVRCGSKCSTMLRRPR
jgi:hypothetical protein